MVTHFDFEQPIAEIERQIAALEAVEQPGDADRARLDELRGQLTTTREEIYRNLTPWQRVPLARHLQRPHALEYIQRLFTDWTEVKGDRVFGDDAALLAGFARFRDQPVAVLGQQKGADLKENVHRNYGMMHPEGYRKAMRVMRMAEKFNRPVICLIDTSGAFPGIGAEERGQAEAIARNIMEMSMLRTPVLCCVIGEGGSGGALGIGVGDRLLMQENAFYSVIPPEGCAAILWRDAKFAPQAADALKITARDLVALGIADDVVPEPPGGAHRDPEAAATAVGAALGRHLDELQGIAIDELLDMRLEKYRKIGVFQEEA